MKHPLLLFFVCLALYITAYDASATTRQTGTAEYSTQSQKTPRAAKASSKSGTAGVVKKKPPKTTDKSVTASSAKHSSKKQQTQETDKAKTKDATSRSYKKASRDPDSLPSMEEAFSETPDAVLAVLSIPPADGTLSSSYGMRRLSKKSKTRRVRMHAGIDISLPRGTPVLAPASGVVRFAGSWAAYGKVIELDHRNGLVTRYAHLDSKTVTEGAEVAAGEQIGTVGRTGRTTGAHLHFETLVNGRAVDPLLAAIWQLPPEQLAEIHDMKRDGHSGTNDQVRKTQAGDYVEHVGVFSDSLVAAQSVVRQAGAADQHGNP